MIGFVGYCVGAVVFIAVAVGGAVWVSKPLRAEAELETAGER